MRAIAFVSGAETAVEPFDPQPGVLYTLESAAHLTGVSRRSILVYCKEGMISPVLEPAYGALLFSAEMIRAIRQIEDLRQRHGINIAGVRLIFDLLREVEELRSEVRFLRGW